MKEATALRLYRVLLRCYPRRFRQEFGDELVVLIESAKTFGFGFLASDCLRSVVRQWLMVLEDRVSVGWPSLVPIASATLLTTAVISLVGSLDHSSTRLTPRMDERATQELRKRVYAEWFTDIEHASCGPLLRTKTRRSARYTGAR